jgi:glycosyltransferase involved in cell wall biosynthesis
MSNTENILLLTDVPPCENYSGGAFLNQLSSMLIEEKISLFGYFMPPGGLNIVFNQFVKNKIECKFASYLNDTYNDEKTKNDYLKKLNAVIDDCVGFINENKITKIWCYVQCENILRLLEGVYEKTKISYVIQIMDPIDWHIKARGFDIERKKDILILFNNAVNKSSFCLTASDNMNSIYKKIYKVPCEYITVSHKPIDTKKEKYIDKDSLIISFAGQVYCVEETKNLISALEKMNWKYNEKKIILKYYGSFELIKFVQQNNLISKNNIKNIMEMGYIPQQVLNEELNNSHLLYCPYFFSNDEALRKVSEQSFPSKLIAYLNSNTNVLVHGPSYSSPVKFVKKNLCGFTIESNNIEDIVAGLQELFNNIPSIKYINNAKAVFEENFDIKIIKRKFFNALGLKICNDDKTMMILEVNNVDIYGGRFNGYDRIKPINGSTNHVLNQIVTYKFSDNRNVYKYYDNHRIEQQEENYRVFENSILSTHSQFSVIGELLLNSDVFKKSNIVHYHLIHNTKIPLSFLTHLFSLKPTVITIHDTWNFTGRCVYPFECENWKSGCEECNNLTSLFPFKVDNCKYLWKEKEKIAKQWDIDVIVATNFLDDKFVKLSPITKHFENVHLLPFGVDLELFKDNNNKYEIREKLNINKDDIVIFVRSQKGIKCAEEVRQALQILKTDRTITILTCSEIGNFDDLKNKYNIIEFGNITDLKIIEAFNACDFFLMPTKAETFGVMAIEAMACSRAIIVFDNMTLPQVTFAPECGLLVENLNVEKLADAIKYLIDNEDERIRRGKLGRELAEKHYDVRRFNEEVVKIYEKAYERQNYKLNNPNINHLDYDYNVDNINVRKLIYAINKNFKLIFGTEEIIFNFDTSYIDEEFDDNIYDSIDYSDDEVIKFLNYFNNKVYLHYKDMVYYSYSSVCDEDGAVVLVNNSNPAENRNKIYKLYYYLRYDRFRLKEAVKWRLANKPRLYTFAKKSYNTFKRIKYKF